MADTPIRPHIRPANAADAGGVARLIDALGYPCSDDEAFDRIETVDSDPTQALLVADLHGELCGLVALDFMYFLPLGCETCRITALVVDDKHRGGGVGRLLLREAESIARSTGAARIEVTHAAQRTEASQFYRACGYVENSIRLVKRLGEA